MHPKSHSHHQQCTSNSHPPLFLSSYLPTLFLHSNPPPPLVASSPSPFSSSSSPSSSPTPKPRKETHTHSMEVSTKQLLPVPHRQDPNSPSSSTSSSSSSSTSPSHPHHHRAQPHNLPPSPRPIPRTIDTTPFPTTFVQADTTSFKQVVQMLTGAEQPAKNDATTAAAAAGSSGSAGTSGGGQAAGGPCRPKKPSFKLYERRSSMKNLKMIAPLAMGPPPSPRRATPEILSPSVLDFPSLRLSSPVTPLTGDPFNRSPASTSSSEEAERAAIAERGFFLHPSPRGAEPPRLLPLFPVTSPRMAAPAAAPSE
ncbi:hypothetical protein SETIT_5G316700v2 [Setaria italica]|uniref:VQ domain-containing protein n=4 Tax=Setaria TaxID=4554 RepID=A0A368RB82_SETIT|nr:hypothetical protein SETIT_5G316700v2 [Setaria italica]